MSPKRKDRYIAIIQELCVNPKLNNSELARKVGLSRPTVVAYVERLQNEGYLTFKAGMDIGKLRYKMATVELEIKGFDDQREFLQVLKSCPRVLTIFKTAGKANIQLGIWGETDN